MTAGGRRRWQIAAPTVPQPPSVAAFAGCSPLRVSSEDAPLALPFGLAGRGCWEATASPAAARGWFSLLGADEASSAFEEGAWRILRSVLGARVESSVA